jgi:hypothetical protein
MYSDAILSLQTFCVEAMTASPDDYASTWASIPVVAVLSTSFLCGDIK